MSSAADEASIPFVLSAPSGAGKTTLAAELLRCVDRLERVVTCTTRPPRPGEADGRDYTFLDMREFQRMTETGGFLEFAHVHGNYYGTPRAELERIRAGGNDALMVIDVQGAASVRERLEDAVTIFVLPPSKTVLERRLGRRDGMGGATGGANRQRLSVAADEIAQFVRYDYVVINDDIEVAVRELEAIVVAERCRPSRRSETGRAILESFR